MGRGVDGDVAGFQNVAVDQRGGGRGMAQLHADARHEDVDRHRLDHVVVGTDLEGGDDPAVVAVPRHDDDRRARPHAQVATELDAVDVREAEVEQDDVVVGAVDGVARRPSVADGRDLEAARNEPELEDPSMWRIVLDHQD